MSRRSRSRSAGRSTSQSVSSSCQSPAERGEAPARVLEHVRAAPGDAGEERRVRPGQPDQHVAAVLGRCEHGVGSAGERRVGRAQVLRRERGTVAADQDRDRRGGERAPERGMHPVAEIAGALCRERRAVRARERGEDGVRDVGCAAELDRTRSRCGCGRERTVDEPLVKRGSAGGAERGNEARLHLAGDRRLGEDQDGGVQPLVDPAQALRRCAEEVAEPQPPHQYDRPHYAARLPAPPRRDARSRRQSGGETRFSRLLSATSSISASAGNPPTLANESRATKIAWSPVAIPVSRERRFISQATSREQRAAALDPHVEAPPARAGCGEPVQHRAIGACRKTGVGVQEEQDVARRRVGAGVHLGRAAARRGEDAIGERPRRVRRAVAAAAVDDDDLVARGAKRLQRRERRADAGGFVERGDDHRELHAL